ncbi:MAG: preprotein translocase subunit SecG [Bacteroidales bacterium]
MGFIVGLIMVVCVLLILIVLAQKSKGGGLAANYSSVNQVVGVQSSTNIAEKGTWYLALALVVLVIMSTKITYSGGENIIQDTNNEYQQEQIKRNLENQQQNFNASPIVPENTGGTEGTTTPEADQSQPEGASE